MPNLPVSRVERLEKIKRMLFHSTQGLRVVEIAQACGVDRRTIYRDLVALEEGGVPLRQEDGRYSVIREQYQTTLQVSLNEAVMLCLATRLFSRFTKSQNPHLVSVLAKLSGALVEPLASHVKLVAKKMRDFPPDSEFARVLDTVTLAWLQRRKVRLWYAAARGDDIKHCDLSPYFVEPTTQGDLYLVGRDSLTGQIRPLDLRRVRRARVLDEPAQVAGNEDVARA